MTTNNYVGTNADNTWQVVSPGTFTLDRLGGVVTFTLGFKPVSTRLRKSLLAWLVLLFFMNPVWPIEVDQSLPQLGIAEIKPIKGQFLYIDFWASWCGPCRQSFPWMNALQAKYGPRGLKVVSINLDAKRSDADKFLAHTPALFTVIYDDKADTAKRLAIKAMPTSLLVSPDGRVLWVHSGFRKEDVTDLEARVAKVLTVDR